TLLGALIVLAAAVLTGLPPGMHREPVWPFAVRPSLAIVAQDPILREEVANAVLALLGALALVALGIVARRIRWLAIATAAAIAWFAVPHFDLLFMPAYPTSFYRSPTHFSARAIAAGAALYPRYCASCHGASGRGDGPAAKGLALLPADLTLPHLFAHSDGELFWRLSQGFPGPHGGVAMPGFRSSLSDAELWDLIDFLRARNGGLARRDGEDAPRLPAPDFDISCAGRAQTLGSLRGTALAIGFGADVAVTTADGLTCTAAAADVTEAYAIATGQTKQALAGGTVIVDANGWLRDALGPGQTREVAAALGAAAHMPLPPDATWGGEHMHHHHP
ncbi:MAG: cytochrome c, partial [Acetobacteraceae bacterium]|nr:cytochrome c [Acetobacteraceae bacterium]